jgi:hypothetical protein
MISILIPTRKRPHNIQKLWDSITRTVHNPIDIELVLYIDEDDKSYKNLKMPYKKVNGERIVLSDMWNVCAKEATNDIMMYCGDDVLFRTKNWDRIVISAFDKLEDKIGYVFGRDGSVHDGIYGTHGFVHRNWFDALGYICPPVFSGDYSDTWINDVAKLVDRHIFIDILTEHMHPDFNKTELDDTYKEKYERMNRDKTADIYFSMASERYDDANKLRKVMK